MVQLLYIVYFLGVALWQEPVLYRIEQIFRSRISIRRNLKQYTHRQDFIKAESLTGYIQRLIEGAEAEKWIPSPQIFYLLSVICGLSAALIVSFLGSASLSAVCGLFTGFFPFAILTARLYGRRVARSREGDILVQELLNNYKIHDYNMKEAIEITAFTIEEAPGAKRLLLQLGKGLQTAASRMEIENLLRSFRFSLDTSWGNVLSVNIFFACMYGIRVDGALTDLLSSITSSRSVIEHEKRENNEARMMLWYLVPVSYLLSVFAACRYFGFTPAKFAVYQWGTALGLRWFFVMAMLYTAGLFLYAFFSKEKMDI